VASELQPDSIEEDDVDPILGPKTPIAIACVHDHDEHPLFIGLTVKADDYADLSLNLCYPTAALATMTN